MDQANIPVLGICYGHQLIVNTEGGTVSKSNTEFGRTTVNILKDDELFYNVPKRTEVWMSHGDAVTKVPAGFEVIANSDYSGIASYRSKDQRVRGIQFHPEVTHTVDGLKILENFCSQICRVEKAEPWTAKRFVEEESVKIKNMVGEDKILLALSGGVDSMTLAGFLRGCLKRENIQSVYVDTGLMPDNTKNEVVDFCRKFDIPLEIIEAEEEFLSALKGVIDPKEKGKAIGLKFIEVFERYASTVEYK